MYPEGTPILVVDSEARRRQHGERILMAEGFAVTAVADVFSGMRAAVAHRFALAVVAVELPGTFDGIAALKQLRARQPWLKALFTGDAAQLPAWLDHDRDDFIAAPFQRRELLGCVFELLQRECSRPHIGHRDLGRAG